MNILKYFVILLSIILTGIIILQYNNIKIVDLKEQVYIENKEINEQKKIINKKLEEKIKKNPLKSNIDFNNNGIDDYTDILIGAKKEAKNKPKYNGKYWQGGYPPEEIGVCTDVIWRSLKEAGYNLKAMIDKDINLNQKDYEAIDKPDPNIDFRRVKNQHAFFKKYAETLTTDIRDTEHWQPGDIVIFRNDYHIGVVSNIVDEEGISYVIHNLGQSEREENFFKREKPIAHFRFNAEKIDPNILIKWE